MGCCLSTKKASSSSSCSHPAKHCHSDLNHCSFPQKPPLENRAPPPSADEETIKELLSETPNPKPPLPISQPHRKIHQQLVGIEEIQEKQSIYVDKNEQQSPTITENSVAVDESASEEASEICSLSFSESVSTTTVTDKREDEEQVTQRVFRSPAKLAPAPTKRDTVPQRDRVMGRSPNQRTDRSPGKRVVQSRENVRRGARPDPGESSGRRSRSLVVDTSVVGRSPSGRRAGKSPGPSRVEPMGSGDNGKKQSGKSSIEGNDTVTGASQIESLENPLVSLECFIFL